jgi:hypothetical protein
MLDSYQAAAIVLGGIQVIFISVYFGSNSTFVSDLLFQVVPYRVLMTLFVVVQCVFCFMFVCRLFRTLRWLFYVQTVAIVACIVGWIVLNTKYMLADGTTSDVHKYGTLVFMMGMIAYFACLVYSIRSDLAGHNPLRSALAYTVIALLVTTFALGMVFVVGLFDGNPDAWVFEHSSFLTIALAHMAFFVLESPDPWLAADEPADPQYTPIRIQPGDVTCV